MNKQDELLKPEEISDAKADAVLSWLESNKPSPRVLASFVFSDEYEALIDKFLLKAQLAKAKPIIEKQERDNCIEILNRLGQGRAADDLFLYFYGEPETIGQALKGD